MGVSSTARLPSLGAQSIPPLFSHLQHTSNAKVVARWSITIRSFRAVPVPKNAWPSADKYDSSFLPTDSDDASASGSQTAASASGSSSGALGSGFPSGGGAGSSALGAPPLTKPRTMWQVQLSDHPGVVFVIVEDTGRSSRAKVWRDWEVSTKKWKKQKRREIAERRKREVQAEAEKKQLRTDAASINEAGAVEANKTASVEQTQAQGEGQAATNETVVPMEEDAPPSNMPEGDLKAEQAATSLQVDLHSSDAEKPAEAGPSAAADKDSAEPVEQEAIESAGPKPRLRLPSHTRYTVSAITSSMSAMLSGLNLPPPHGAPVGTAGPGAWVPRGAAVSIEGLVLEINSQSLNALPGISPSLASLSTAEDVVGGAGTSGGVDWRVRVGSVMGGGNRSAGAIVEAEFLPASTLLPTSKFMHDFLLSLFPPGLVPMPPPAAPMAAPGMPNVNPSRGTAAPSVAGGAMPTTTMNSAALGFTPIANGCGLAAGTNSSGSGFSYTIGGGAGAAMAPPNRSFNIPVVSDQLWEEVVPRSGEGWRRRIAKRSQQMVTAARAEQRRRKKAVDATSTQNGKATNGTTNKNGDTDAFGWHTFDSDDGEEDTSTPPANAGGDWQDEDEGLSSSESESEATLDAAYGAAAAAGGLAGTAVTMQQADEGDDDDDDDRPLGAPIWSNTSRPSTATNPANPAAAPATAVKKEDTVQLIFQGLRPDVNEVRSTTDDGWSGIERGRRIAFQYVQMLRAEGII